MYLVTKITGGGSKGKKGRRGVEARRDGIRLFPAGKWQTVNGGTEKVWVQNYLSVFYQKLHNERAELEAKKTSEKDEEIKRRNEEILQLKSDIYDLKDVYTRYTSYGKFLEKISPEDWRNEKVVEKKKID